MAINIRDTMSLMQAVERIKPPATVLVDTFFPVTPVPALGTKIAVEYRKGNRRLAPFIVEGGHGVPIVRDGSNVNVYEPPVVAPRRILRPEDIEQRGFGETVMTSTTPAQRATQIQAHDLMELQGMIMNRKNQMAAEILTTGKYTIEGYADDGVTKKTATISYNWTQKTTAGTAWDQAGADIWHDIKNASEVVQENAGMVPTVMMCGKNVTDYILHNDSILKWLMVPSANNLSLMSIQPRITSPQVVRVGLIQALNLEIYSYAETYVADDGTNKPFLGDDDVIIGIPGRGKQLHGAVTLLNEAGDGFETYSGLYVPQYSGSKTDNTLSLTMFSRFLLAPEMADDWFYIKTKG